MLQNTNVLNIYHRGILPHQAISPNLNGGDTYVFSNIYRLD